MEKPLNKRETPKNYDYDNASRIFSAPCHGLSASTKEILPPKPRPSRKFSSFCSSWKSAAAAGCQIRVAQPDRSLVPAKRFIKYSSLSGKLITGFTFHRTHFCLPMLFLIHGILASQSLPATLSGDSKV